MSALPPPDLRRYYLPSDQMEGYAWIVLDLSVGYFSTVSDYGSYAFRWSHPGGEFRRFLMLLQPDYLFSKLTSGWSHQERTLLDGRATKKAVFERIRELARLGKTDRYVHERDVYRETLRERNYDLDDMRAWYERTRFDDAHEIIEYRPSPQVMAFCEKTWPRLVKVLEAELAAEAALVGKVAAAE